MGARGLSRRLPTQTGARVKARAPARFLLVSSSSSDQPLRAKYFQVFAAADLAINQTTQLRLIEL